MAADSALRLSTSFSPPSHPRTTVSIAGVGGPTRELLQYLKREEARVAACRRRSSDRAVADHPSAQRCDASDADATGAGRRSPNGAVDMAPLLMVADDDDAVDRGAARCPLVLRPLAEVLDAAHRCIVTLQDHVVNPAIPPPMRDHGLASLQGVFRLAQQRVLLPRLLCLCEAMLDISRDIDLLRRDVRAASDS